MSTVGSGRFANMACWLCGFNTTELATNVTTPTCKNDPCHICLAITEVNEEINQAVATLQHLIAKRRNLCSEQNRAHDPIYRLPPEIRNHVFELVLPLRDMWGTIDQFGPYRDRAPVMPPFLTSICKSWRDIAWSNPLLWSTIPIVLSRPRTSDRGWIKFLRRWILRSQTSPLTVNIFAQEYEGAKKELEIVLNTISRSSNRWHSLALQLPPQLLNAWSNSDFQLQRLKKFMVLMEQPGLLPLSFLNSEVRLEQIEMAGIPFRLPPASWDHLTSAVVVFWTLEEVVHLLQHASQLTYCHIGSLFNFDPDFTLSRTIHQKLQILRLFECEKAATKLLESLTLPSLRELHFIKTVPLRCLPALVQRSSCPLTGLMLIGSDVGVEALDGLPHMSGVTHLFLKSAEAPSVSSDSFEYCERLIQNLDEYFPNLSHLSLGLDVFISLWRKGTLPTLLDYNIRSQPDTPKKGTLRKVLVRELRRVHEFPRMIWRSGIGEQLKASKVDVKLRDDGFEIWIREN